jgi:hypothetical protein
MYYELMFGSTLMFICLFIFRMSELKSEQAQKKRNMIKSLLLRKIVIAERMLFPKTVSLPNETLLALNTLILDLYGRLQVQGFFFPEDRLLEVKDRMLRIKNNDSDITNIAMPQDDEACKLAKQELFRLHQFFSTQIKIIKGPTEQFQTELSRIELVLLDTKIKSLLRVGERAVSTGRLVSARECFCHAIDIINNDEDSRHRFSDEYQFAQDNIDIVDAMRSPFTKKDEELDDIYIVDAMTPPFIKKDEEINKKEVVKHFSKNIDIDFYDSRIERPKTNKTRNDGLGRMVDGIRSRWVPPYQQ